MPITLREYLLTTLAALPFLFVCVYFGSVGGILISTAGEIDRSAIGRLAVAFSAAIVLLGIVAEIYSSAAGASFRARGWRQAWY
jgi:hypothetical protein